MWWNTLQLIFNLVKRSMKKIKIVFTVIIIVITIAACSSSKKSSASTITSTPPATIGSGSPATTSIPVKPANGIYPPGNEELTAIQAQFKEVSLAHLKEGHFIYTEGACVKCHDAQNIYARAAPQWKNIIDDMAKRSNLTDPQKDAVYKYVLSIKAVQANANTAPPALLMAGPEPEPDLQISQYIRRMFRDTAGNIWFGTQGDGLCRYDARLNDSPGPGRSLTYFTTKDGLSHNIIRGILQDKSGDLWIGTAAGVSRYDGKTFTSVVPKENSGVQNSDVWSSMKDNKGNLWFGTLGGNVLRWDGETLSNFQIPIPPNDIKNEPSTGGFMTPYELRNRVSCILQDKNGKIWFGTASGLCLYDGDKFSNLTMKDGLGGRDVLSILEDRSGNIWLGTRDSGLYYCEAHLNDSPGQGKKFSRFSGGEALANGVWTMLEDKMGNIWFGTIGGGLWKYNPSTLPNTNEKAFTQFTIKDGLGNTHVQSILEDKNVAPGETGLWIGTSGGVYRYDGKVFTNFTRGSAKK
jgi:ligand-binding sensor domain-containing protein